MRIQLKDLITKWGTDRIRYFLSVKEPARADLGTSISWPQKIINKIENQPLFKQFEHLTFTEMQDLTIQCEVLFSQHTKKITHLIEKIPHNYQLTDNDFVNEKCLVMVDASIKKNGNEIFYGIAGCIRNENGNIVSGFAIPIYSKDVIDSTTLELMAIEEGTKLANSYHLKDYTVVSDCISDAIKLHKLNHGFIPMTKDYYANEDIYLRIHHTLKNDNATIAYVPRDYNNIADQYSKSYMSVLHKNFQNNQVNTEIESRETLNSNNISSNNIYFYHDNLNSYLNNTPYDLEKNFQHNFLYDKKKHDQYELYVMPFYNQLNKTIYNYAFIPNTLDYTLLFEYPVDLKKENSQDAHFNNLELLLLYCTEQKTAIFTGNGLVAKTNKITTITQKELPYYQKLYKLLDNVKEVSFFAYDNNIKNQIEKAIQKNLLMYSSEKLKYS